MAQRIQWAVKIDELVGIFRDAIRSLAPIVELARIQWREPAAHDDWDQICGAIFESVVTRSIEYDAESDGALNLPKYDCRVVSYLESSYLSEAGMKGNAAFVCFETKIAPFDTCLFALLDDELKVIGSTRLLAANARFVYARRYKSRGTTELVETLNVLL